MSALYVYTRITLPLDDGTTTTMPTVIHGPNGAQRIVDISPQQLEGMAQTFIAETKVRVKRWKIIGASPEFIKRTMERLNKEVSEEIGDVA